MRKCVGVLIGVLMAVSASAAMAKSTEYLCKLNSKGQMGWIPPEMIIVDVPGNKTMMVIDGYIIRYNDKKPMGAKVTSVQGNNVTFSHKLRMQASNGAILRVRYTSTFNRKTRAIQTEAKLLNPNQRQFARGSCAPRK